ncbi:MAG: anthranilate synthase component I family protein [Fodinibius sp.]|nr:anthranilate synthase component I family protein [Fodinibius sp.]
MMLNITHLAQYLAARGPVLLLESQSREHPWSKKSYLAACPTATIRGRNDDITMSEKGTETHQKGNPWEALRAFRERYNDWLLGYLGYDMKNHLEELQSMNPDPVEAPDMYFMIPGFLMEIDHQKGEWELIKGELPAGYPGSDEELDNAGISLDEIAYRTSREQYLLMIEQAQHQIVEGDFYEINISHQLSINFTGNPWTLYRRMKEVGPVPFGACLQLDDWSVCCQSPERFLRKEGRMVFSQPIKGTTQRGSNDREDESLKNELLSSDKERAENLMIVDLVRNDLGRIARRGTVDVPELFSIQSFGTVHQMVSTVTAEAEETDPVKILEACFPMGSMTGAPKISAMTTIEELENYRRGIYSGAIGLYYT